MGYMNAQAATPLTLRKRYNWNMWKMSLKQRRRHSELMTQLERMRDNQYLWPPADYVVGEDEAEDEKFRQAQAAFQALVEELHQLEQDAR